MKTFKIVPQIVEYESSSDFCNEFKIGSGDLVFLSKSRKNTLQENSEKHMLFTEAIMAAVNRPMSWLKKFTKT